MENQESSTLTSTIKNPIQFNYLSSNNSNNSNNDEWESVTLLNTNTNNSITINYDDLYKKSIITNLIDNDNNTIETLILNSTSNKTPSHDMIKTFIEEYYNETNEQNNEQIILALNNYIVSKLIFNEILEKGDGNCFYRTLADRVKDDHMRIREKILNYMLEMFADFQNNYNLTIDQIFETTFFNQIFAEIDTINKTTTNKIAGNTHEEKLNNYINFMKKDTIWGGTVELNTFVNMLNYNAFTINSTATPETSLSSIYQMDYPNIIKEDTNVIFLRFTGNHYNLLYPIRFKIDFNNNGNYNNNIENIENIDFINDDLGEGINDDIENNDFIKNNENNDFIKNN